MCNPLRERDRDWKRTNQSVDGGGGLASCSCDSPSWHLEEGRRRWTEQSCLPPASPTRGSVKCELLQPKTECSQVYSTSATTYGHYHNTVYSKYTSAWNVAVSAVITDWSSPAESNSHIYWFVHVIKMSFDTLKGCLGAYRKGRVVNNHRLQTNLLQLRFLVLGSERCFAGWSLGLLFTAIMSDI